MILTNMFRFRYSFVALSIGIVFMYLTPAEMTKVVVYPTPDNKDEFLYGDKVGNCYKFEQVETQCPCRPKPHQANTFPRLKIGHLRAK